MGSHKGQTNGGFELDHAESTNKQLTLNSHKGQTNRAFELDHADSKDEKQSKFSSAIKRCFHACTRPCLAETHPLPPNASFCRRFADNFLCPPHSRMGAILFVLIIGAILWTTLFSLTGDEALPGGNLFALSVVFLACWSGGYLAQIIRLPPLLGMLIVGGVLGNAPHINVAKDVHPSWSVGCRTIALTVILIRAGLGLDPKALRRLSLVVVRLAFLPCLTETLVDGIAAHLILGFSWPWAFMLGFVIAAVSPAVVVPSLISLSERSYGIVKGVPTLIIAAASIDDVLAITGFGVLLGISFSSGNIAWTLVKGPLEALSGIVYGVVTGVICWYIPQKSSKHLILFRSLAILFFGFVAIFGSKKVEWSGAGPLGTLTLAFVAAFRWRLDYQDGTQNPVEGVVGVVWMIFQPLLFGLIGAEVDVATLDGDTVGKGIAVLAIGLAFRMVVSFSALFRTDLNLKERLFVPFAWLPKATVQAAIGAIALDTATERGDEDLMDQGKKILNLAVLSIMLTAPFGSFMMAILGPLFLHQDLKPDGRRRRSSILVVGNDGFVNDAVVIDDEIEEEDEEMPTRTRF